MTPEEHDETANLYKKKCFPNISTNVLEQNGCVNILAH